MNSSLAVIKVIFKTSTGGSQNGFAVGGRRKSKKAGQAYRRTNPLFIAGVYLLIFVGMSFLCYSNMSIAHSVGLEREAFAPTFLYMVVMALTMTFLSCFSTYFLNSDSEHYLPMPIKPSLLFWGRFLSASFYSLLMSAVFIIPGYLMAAIFKGFSPTALLNAIVTVIAFSTAVNACAFLIGNILARFFNLAAYKERLATVMSIIMIVAIIAMSLLMSLGGSDSEAGEESIITAIQSQYDALSWARFIFYFPTEGAFGDTGSSLLATLVSLGVFAGSLLVSLVVARLFYIKTLLNGQKGKRRKRIDSKTVLSAYEVSTRKNAVRPLRPYLRRELNDLRHSGAALIQYLMPPLIFSVVFTVTLVTMGYAFKSESEATASVALASVYAIFLPMIVVNPSLAAVSISKEGKDFYSLRALPLNYKLLMQSKLIIPVTLVFIPAFVLCVAAPLCGAVDPLTAVLGLISQIFLTVGLCSFDLLHDSKVALLNWTNEYEYIKRFTNTMPHIGLAFLLTIVEAVPLIVCAVLSLPLFIGPLITLFLNAGFVAFFYTRLTKTFERNLMRIE